MDLNETFDVNNNLVSTRIAHRGIEPLSPAWDASILTTRRMGLIIYLERPGTAVEYGYAAEDKRAVRTGGETIFAGCECTYRLI